MTRATPLPHATPLPFLSDDQRAFVEGVRGLLDRELDVGALRAWPAGADRLQAALDGFGVPGVLVPVERGGLGLGPVAAVGLAVELGRAASPLPTLDTVVAAGLIARHGDEAVRASWLPRILAGRATVVISAPGRRFVGGASRADAVLVDRAGALHLVDRERCTFDAQPSTDPLRDLARIRCAPAPGELLTGDAGAGRALRALGALTTAGVLAGLSARMLADATRYACERRQFGRPIGSFQAVQHRLAEGAVLLERATVACHRAAGDLEADPTSASASVARIASGEAARRISVHALQTFGGIGFTEEHHLHLWLKRAKALEAAFGSLHRHREDVLTARAPELRSG